jgi:glutathione S-transferase
MITLFTFPEAFGLRNVSPFCLKVEMALAYLKLDFEIVMEKDPRKTPKGKLPYIVVAGETIPDSELILEYLDNKTDGGLYGNLAFRKYKPPNRWISNLLVLASTGTESRCVAI